MTITKGCFISKQDQENMIRKLAFWFPMSISCLLVLWYFPLDRYQFYPPCPCYFLTGTYCPGCGTLRGLSAILKGDLWGLWRNNPLAMILSPNIIYAGLDNLAKAIFRYSLPRFVVSNRIIILLVLIILIYWVSRNYFPILAPKDFG